MAIEKHNSRRFKSRRGDMKLTDMAIGIVVVIIAVAILFPIAGKLIFNANMTGWDSTSKSTFPLIFLVGVAAIIIGLVVRAFVIHKK